MISVDSQTVAPVGPRVPVKPCRIALAGFGTVGQSVAKLLQRSPGDAALVSVLTRRAADRRVEWAGDAVRWTESIDEALEGTDVFVELIGGLGSAAPRSPAARRGGHSRA